ncbi:unnamed protein product, partial [Cyprideis torosa]
MESPNFFATEMTTEVINNHLWLRKLLQIYSPATTVTTFPSSEPHLGPSVFHAKPRRRLRAIIYPEGTTRYPLPCGAPPNLQTVPKSGTTRYPLPCGAPPNLQTVLNQEPRAIHSPVEPLRICKRFQI